MRVRCARIAAFLAVAASTGGCADDGGGSMGGRVGAGAPAASPCVAGPGGLEGYLESVRRGRAREDRQLRGPFSPLAKTGTVRVPRVGATTIGSAPDGDLTLSAPDVLPTHAEVTAFASEVVVRAVPPATLRTWDADNELYDLGEMSLKPGYGFQVGRFTLHFDSSAYLGRYLEVFDPEVPAVRSFTGQGYFPPDTAYCVRGALRPAKDAVPVELLDSRGGIQQWWLAGTVSARVQGAELELELYREHTKPIEPSERMLVIFRDSTSGYETYPAARYLGIRVQEDGSVVLDFNRAYNPPCVYSPAYSCPFARPQNNIAIPIRAGATWYRGQGY